MAAHAALYDDFHTPETRSARFPTLYHSMLCDVLVFLSEPSTTLTVGAI